MKNLLLLFTIFGLTACTSSDSDSDNPSTITPPTIAETIIGNWSSQTTNAEGSFLNRVTFTEAGEMSIYILVTTTDGTVVEEIVEGKNWTLNGDQITTTDTLENDVDTTTVTVVNQNSITILTPEGDVIALTRDSDYESKLEQIWVATRTNVDCDVTFTYDFTTPNELLVSNYNGCTEVTQVVTESFTQTGGILSGSLSFVDENELESLIYFSTQGDKLYISDIFNNNIGLPMFTKL
tara:strand:+ start:1314 stop:2024 length:711 start_codon:yes stop_codon:yes gene_type:complete